MSDQEFLISLLNVILKGFGFTLYLIFMYVIPPYIIYGIFKSSKRRNR